MILNEKQYVSKVLGCWMGKNIGGTLGAPMEWRRQVNHVSFYTQDLRGEPLPNDDLDIQLLWVVAMEERGIEITAQTLADYWCMYLTPHWVEYGNAKINMRSGLMPPLSGNLHNPHKDSCGAFIRSEIWACITPGLPHLAARYAYEDGILDHGDGEGMYAEVFTAVLESAAFVEGDLRKLIDIGLSYIPEDCGVAGAVKCAIASYDAKVSWQEARDTLLKGFRGSSFINNPAHTSPEDHKKGFGEGKLGYDVPSNIGIIVIGLLYGEGDFDKSICTAVNCGEDTDCTGATVGSIFGILHGIEGIPTRWIEPIGRKIKTCCLNLGELGGGGSLPQDVDEMTARTLKITRQVLMRYARDVELSDRPTDLAGLTCEKLLGQEVRKKLYTNLHGPVYVFDFFSVAVDYGQDGPFIRDNQRKTIRLKIRNTYKVQANLSLHVYSPENWKILPGRDGAIFSTPVDQPVETVELTIEAPVLTRSTNRLAVELTAEGRPTVMLVPLVLMNGNFQAPQTV